MSDLSAIRSAQPFFEQLEAGVLLLDAELRPLWSNRFYSERLEQQISMCDKHCFTGLQPDEARCEDCLPPQVLRTGRTLETVRSAQRPDGGLLYYRVILTPLSEGNTTRGSSGVAIFLLPLPADELDSPASWRERFLLSAIRSSNDAVFALDRQHTVRFWNQGAERLFGLGVGDVAGRTIEHLFPEETRTAAEEVFTPHDPTRPLSNRELPLISASRGEVWVEVTRTPLLDGSGRPNGYSFVVRDVTERRQALEQMAFTERMSAVGNMAAALAHEIGTPLGVISNNAEVLLLDLPPDDPRRTDLEMIVSEAERIGGLVRDLLNFSRPEKPELEAVQVGDVLNRVERLVHHASRKQGTEIELQVEPQLPPVHADANQLEQVVLNLTMNALQALDEGGCVHLGARAQAGPVGSIHRRPTRGVAGIVVEVEDDGPGIVEGDLERIFHPFFTTKSNGTGLGLAVCKRIVEEHGGSISAQSDGKRGAAFRVWLPSRVGNGSS